VVDPRTGAVTVGEDAAVSDILTMEIGEMSLVQAQTVNFLIASGTKVDGGLKATISCTDGSVFVKNLFEGQEVAFAGNCVGAATELFFRLRIATYEDMVNFAQECADDNGGAIVDLQADIDMRNVPWTPVENFTGTFNGNGHRIYNINVSADGRYAGFFAYAKGAISDVVFGSKDGTSYDGTSRIELKYSADTDTWCYAGIVAQSNNTLTGVTSFVPVTVTADSRCKSRTGGIVGSLYNGKMSGCRNYGAVSNVATAGVASYVAGIAGIVERLGRRGRGDHAGRMPQPRPGDDFARAGQRRGGNYGLGDEDRGQHDHQQLLQCGRDPVRQRGHVGSPPHRRHRRLYRGQLPDAGDRQLHQQRHRRLEHERQLLHRRDRGRELCGGDPGLHERSRGEIRAGQCRRRGLPCIAASRGRRTAGRRSRAVPTGRPSAPTSCR